MKRGKTPHYPKLLKSPYPHKNKTFHHFGGKPSFAFDVWIKTQIGFDTGLKVEVTGTSTGMPKQEQKQRRCTKYGKVYEKEEDEMASEDSYR